MILDKIRSILKPNTCSDTLEAVVNPDRATTKYDKNLYVDVKTLNKALKKAIRSEELPTYLNYNEYNGVYRIVKKGIHYGTYHSKEEGLEALQRLKDNNWDKRAAYNLPTDKVYYNKDTGLYIIHKTIDGVEYNFGEYKRAPNVQRRLKLLEEKNYPLCMSKTLEKDLMYKLQENTEPEGSYEIESPYYREKYPQGSYFYDIQHDCFTLPNKQGKCLNINAVEAFTMIKLYNKGYNLKDIWEKVEWSNPNTRYSTLKTWWRKFNEGLMDLALNFIIRSSLVSSELWRN